MSPTKKTAPEKRPLQINHSTSISIGLGIAAFLAIASLARDKGKQDEQIEVLKSQVTQNTAFIQSQSTDKAEVNARLTAIETKLNIVMIALGIDGDGRNSRFTPARGH